MPLPKQIEQSEGKLQSGYPSDRQTLTTRIPRLIMRGFYNWRYLRGATPWDTNITPPEVVQLIEQEKFPPGRALDLGCGTGTNALYLAKHGFDVIGIDYVTRAIETARHKALAQNARVDFRAADVLSLSFDQLFDYILDIGCFHSIDPAGRERYAENIRRWTHDGSVFMTYAFFPFHALGRVMGISRAEMERLFAKHFFLTTYADDGKSAWYRWVKK